MTSPLAVAIHPLGFRALTFVVVLLSGIRGVTAATFNVTHPGDDGAGSLRGAVALANANSGADQITFDAGLGTITLTSGQIDITDPLTITGPAAGQTISGNNASRIFAVTSDSAPLTLEHLVLTAGHTTDDGGMLLPAPRVSPDSIEPPPVSGDPPPPPSEPGDPPPGDPPTDPGDPPEQPSGKYTCAADTGEGGAICSLSGLTLIDCEVMNSGTDGYLANGGGVFVTGTGALIRSTIADNSTTGEFAAGGGLYVGGTANLSNSRVSNNSTVGAGANGGGLSIVGSLTMDNSTAFDNTTSGADAGGGGIRISYGPVTLTNSTVSDNSVSGESSGGGGIEVGFGELILTNCTISGNRADGADTRGGGLSILLTNTTLNNTTITDNTSSAGGGGVDFYELTFDGPFNLALRSTILAGNNGPDGNFGLETDSMYGGTSTVTIDATYTLFGDLATEINGTDSGNVYSDAPDLSPLTDNGCAVAAGAPGADSCVQTHAPNPASPAIDRGANPLALANDQRGTGFARVQGGQTDIGAFETPGSATPIIGLAPATLDFGNTRVGDTAAAMTVTISNPGTADLHVTGLTAPVTPFSADGGNCGAVPFTVNAGGSCTLGYSFAPTTTGSSTQTIGVVSDAPAGSDDQFTLLGTGVQPNFELSPHLLDFGPVPLGATSAVMSVTATNIGSTPIQVTAVTIPAAPFTPAGGSCTSAPFTLAAGSSCTLAYTFAPTATGAATNPVSVFSYAAAGSDWKFTLQGTGANDDGDGVDATTEDGAPNDGDGNYDGIPDRDQANVTSLPGADGGSYLTLVVGGSCLSAENVASLSASALDPDPSGRSYPYGLLAFELPCASAEVTIYYHGAPDLAGAEYGKFGPTPDTTPAFDPSQTRWYILPGVTFGSEPLGGGEGPVTAYARFALTNGDWGDDTDTGDDTIVDQGGPGFAPAAIPVLSEWSYWLLAVVLLAFGGLRLSRSSRL